MEPLDFRAQVTKNAQRFLRGVPNLVGSHLPRSRDLALDDKFRHPAILSRRPHASLTSDRTSDRAEFARLNSRGFADFFRQLIPQPIHCVVFRLSQLIRAYGSIGI
jgi:hypothetical protein